MAKTGGNKRLLDLKSILKRFHSFSGQPTTATAATASAASSLRTCQSTSALYPVYVGATRRKYLVAPELFRVLLRHSAGRGVDEEEEAAVVGCEVVFFEHLLWMLENGDDTDESIDELVEFYT